MLKNTLSKHDYEIISKQCIFKSVNKPPNFEKLKPVQKYLIKLPKEKSIDAGIVLLNNRKPRES